MEATMADNDNDNDAIHAAMTAALVILQEHVGQDDGGMASMYWDDDWNGIEEVFRDYLKAEREFLADEP
jgi:hypothetical protein